MSSESGRLDLRACDALMNFDAVGYTRPVEVPQHLFVALLAHCRAVRAALQQFAALIEGDETLNHLSDDTELNIGVPGLTYGHARHFYRGFPRDLAQAELRRRQIAAGNERWEPPMLGDLRRAAEVLAAAVDAAGAAPEREEP